VGGFHGVCQLEYQAQYNTHRNLHRHVAQETVTDTQEIHGCNYVDGGIAHFGCPENEVFSERHFWHGLFIYGFVEVFHEVVGIHPEDDGDTIQGEHVKVLIFVIGFEGLRFTVAQNGCFGDIVIEPVYVGPSVVQGVVFEFPDKGVTSHQAEGVAEQFVHPTFRGKCAMTGIVHYVEASEGVHLADQNEQNHATPDGHIDTYCWDIEGKHNQNGSKDECECGFRPQQHVAVFGYFVCSEIVVNGRTQFIEEIVSSVGESNGFSSHSVIYDKLRPNK
jgi:hypothetical protein